MDLCKLNLCRFSIAKTGDGSTNGDNSSVKNHLKTCLIFTMNFLNINI